MKANVKLATLAASLLSISSTLALAQNNGQFDTQRDVNQQQRIEQGLQSGELTTKEAGQLERQEQRIDSTEARDMRDGRISSKEQAKLNAAQNRVSKGIYRQAHDHQTGNPTSISSRRMEADVHRNITQEKRINQGLHTGQLTNHEAARLEHGQARMNRIEANAGANGFVNGQEQNHVQRQENRQSRHVFHQKHDNQSR